MSNDIIKLRNKKTGDIGFCKFHIVHSSHNTPLYYYSLKEVLEDWEDYKSVEPYIRNERIRKFVRDWAMFNQINTAHVERVNSEIAWFLFVGKDSKYCRWEMAVHADFFETFGENYKNIERPINDFCGEEE